MVVLILYLVFTPFLMLFLAPKTKHNKELNTMLEGEIDKKEISIQQEASNQNLAYKSVSDQLNNSFVLQVIIVLMGLTYIIYYFYTYGFQLNFNIMIFIFLMVGMLFHQTPMRYAIAMKRSSGNISGILFQYPFYAGIMGIMLYTGLGEKMAVVMTSVASIDTYPFYAFLTGGLINFAIPSAGGEFAVIGPSIIKAVKDIGAGMPSDVVDNMVARASLASAYGESLTNALQPFYLLLVFPVMASGTKIQARDIMGYLVIPFIVFFILLSILVTWMPL
jgi:short-chain fatty acids transporter